MTLLPYDSQALPAMTALFYETVHTVCAGDYSSAELDAWATGQVDEAAWDASFLAHRTLLAWENGQLLGFADLAEDGYLDRLYVSCRHQGQGIGTALCQQLEDESGLRHFSTHASITARPFFEKRGYRVVRRQQVERRGVLLTNFVMEK